MLRRLPPTLVVLALLASPALVTLPAREASAQDAVRWRLGRSDFLRYERTVTSRKAGRDKKGATKIVTVHGHDLRDGAQYSPASAVRGDLFQLLALRLPAPGAKSTAVKLDWKAKDAANLRIKGTVGITEVGARIIKIAGSFTFKSRGKVRRGDQFWFDDGTANTTLEFDLDEGVVRSAKIALAYKREDLSKNGPAAILKAKRAYELRLKAIERRRPEDFQKQVDAAIDRGLKHLRGQQKEDGTWKPHGKYTLGTTALAVLTLLACGVPREEENVARALDWIFSQEAKFTYEQATCLMAIDRAYTPASELACLEAGRPILAFERALPPTRMAWVRRTAQALEKSATGGGGSWGYPAPPRSILRFDTSNTQYAVLGLRAAGHLGHRVAERTWLGVIRHCHEVQERKGPKGEVSVVRQGAAIPDEASSHRLGVLPVPRVAGFRYSTVESHGHVSASMTCAGITMLLIARHELRAMQSKKFDRKMEKAVAALILAGWAWLDHHWAMDRNAAHPSHGWYWYYLYSLERAAVLDQVKRVGGKDWYFEGALQLIHRQGETKGDWNDKGGDATPPTCFALLFLKRGTSPLGAPITGDK